MRSNVFADAHALASGEKRLELDDDTETSAIFERFLDLVCHAKLKLDKKLRGIRSLVAFLKKWDCRAAMANLLLSVQSQVLSGNVHPEYAFLFAASVDDRPTASAALYRTDRTWSTLENQAITDGLNGVSVLNPVGWPVALWEEAGKLDNLDYIFALLRAFKEVGNSRKLPRTFERYLAVARALRRRDAGRNS